MPRTTRTRTRRTAAPATAAPVTPARAATAKRKQAIMSPLRREVLEKLGLMTEAEVAALHGCTIKTLRNKPRMEKPASVKLNGERLYPKDGVLQFIAERLDRDPPDVPRFVGPQRQDAA